MLIVHSCCVPATTRADFFRYKTDKVPRRGAMLFSFSMVAKLMSAGMTAPVRGLLRPESFDCSRESGGPDDPASRQRADIVATSTLRDRLRCYQFSVQSNEFRIP